MGLDSVELIMEIEKHFSISIPDRDAEKAYTVGKLVDCVAKLMRIEGYDFSLREMTFIKIKKVLFNLHVETSDFLITKKVKNTINLTDKPFLALVESQLLLKLPGLDTQLEEAKGILPRLKRWFHFMESVDFENITWKKYVDIILALNLEKLNPPILYTSKYEIYIAIMRLTVDKIGVEYQEIGIEKSFTDDLGVD